MDAELDNRTGDAATSASGEDSHYGPYYYEHCCGASYERTEEWLGLFRRFADRIIGDIAPESVLDAGCAMGFLVEALHDRGVDVQGVDISSYAIARAHDSVQDRCRVGSILEPFNRRFDLIVTIEVLEHLKPEDAEIAVANFCAHADDILFSSTPFDYKEASHFNVRPPEYWAGLFARHGFYRDLDHDASYITRWAVRFRKDKLTTPRVVANYERTLWRLIQENLGARESLMEHQDSLIQTEAALVEVKSRKQHLEVASKEFDAKLMARFVAEAALAAEFVATVTSWSNHVQSLDERIRNLTEGMQTAREEIAKRDWQIAKLEQSNGSHDDHVRGQLNEVLGSGAWKLANRLSKIRAWLAPDGSKRRRALKAVLDRHSGRIDAAHNYGSTSDESSRS